MANSLHWSRRQCLRELLTSGSAIWSPHTAGAMTNCPFRSPGIGKDKCASFKVKRKLEVRFKQAAKQRHLTRNKMFSDCRLGLKRGPRPPQGNGFIGSPNHLCLILVLSEKAGLASSGCIEWLWTPCGIVCSGPLSGCKLFQIKGDHYN